MNYILKNIIVFLSVVFLCFIILELFLRIYNPFQTRIKGGEIILPVNQSYIFDNSKIGGVDKKIMHTKNSMGFRGQELPEDYDMYLSIITVGGSAVECFLLSDDRTWPYLLEQRLKKRYDNIWLNNAGLDGHSTFGHIILLRDYIVKLRPKAILFLIGCNDIGRDDLCSYDIEKLRNRYLSLKDFLRKKSEALNFFNNVLKMLKVRRMGLEHQIDLDVTKLDKLEIPEDLRKREIQKHSLRYIDSYKKRVLALLEISKSEGIEPILITQPILWGNEIDKTTGVDLATAKIFNFMNGQLYWEILELYNNATKEIAENTGTYIIDLANKMPKDSVYFYDGIHYTNEGAEEISQIVYEGLKNHW